MDAKLIEHINHPFYKRVDRLVDDVRMMQLQKGAEKYPEPFTPSSWTGKELAVHALQELRDGQVYVVGMLERIEELEEEIERTDNSFVTAYKQYQKQLERTEELESENNRYREAIQKLIKAKYEQTGFDFADTAQEIAEEFELLEGSE